MFSIDADDPLIRDIGSNYLFGVLEMQHFKESKPIKLFFSHGFLAKKFYFLYFVWIFRMKLLLFFLTRFGQLHRIELDLAHRQRFLVDRGELIVHRSYNLYKIITLYSNS